LSGKPPSFQISTLEGEEDMIDNSSCIYFYASNHLFKKVVVHFAVKIETTYNISNNLRMKNLYLKLT